MFKLCSNYVCIKFEVTNYSFFSAKTMIISQNEIVMNFLWFSNFSDLYLRVHFRFIRLLNFFYTKNVCQFQNRYFLVGWWTAEIKGCWNRVLCELKS